MDSVKRYKFEVPGPMMGHGCGGEAAHHPKRKGFRKAVRLLANVEGIPLTIPKTHRAMVVVEISWKKDARLDADDVGKLILDSIFPKAPPLGGRRLPKEFYKGWGDKRVLGAHYIGQEDEDEERAVVFLKIFEKKK